MHLNLHCTSFMLVLGLAACGGSTMEDPRDPQDPPPVEEAIDLSGSWALKVIVGQILTSPLGTAPITITNLARVDAQATSGGVMFSRELCAIELSPYQGATTEYSAAALAALNGDRVAAVVSGRDFEVAQQVELLGWEPEGDPMTEELPEDEDDQRVVDADHDGNPGVTVSVSSQYASGDVYVVNRMINSFAGAVVDEARIEGSAKTEMDQIVVGASEILLTFGQVTSEPDPDPSVNHFTMVRLEGDDTCGRIARDAERLF